MKFNSILLVIAIILLAISIMVINNRIRRQGEIIEILERKHIIEESCRPGRSDSQENKN